MSKHKSHLREFEADEQFKQEEKPERMMQCDNCLTIVPASEIETVAVYSDGVEGDFCERCRGGE